MIPYTGGGGHMHQIQRVGGGAEINMHYGEIIYMIPYLGVGVHHIDG